MSHIGYQTDRWGGEDVDHLEVRIGGDTVRITIDGEKIVIHANKEIVANKSSLNYIEIVHAAAIKQEGEMQILETDCPHCGKAHNVIIQPEISAQSMTNEIERLTRENEQLREWLRGELTLADADIDAALAR
jgi:hypothetical protein